MCRVCGPDLPAHRPAGGIGRGGCEWVVAVGLARLDTFGFEGLWKGVARRRFKRLDRRFGGPVLVTALLQVLGVVVLVLTPAAVLWRVYVRVQGGGVVDADFAVALAAGFVVGVLAGALLLGAAALLQYAHALWKTVYRLEQRAQADERYASVEPVEAAQANGAADAGAPVEVPAAPVPERQALGDVLVALGELRDVMLLPDEERKDVSGRLVSLRRQGVCERIVRAIEDRKPRLARRHLAEGLALFGPSPTFDRLRQRIGELADRVEPLDYACCLRRIDEALADGDWEAAERAARTLAAEHPESRRCLQLLEATRRSRRYAVLQEYATQRRWGEALAAAEEFLQSYPDSAEAESLQGQIATLRENAEIQARKQYETRIHQYVRGKDFAEALRLARHVVETFPHSPQAEALRKQIPALERRVAG